MKKATCVMKRRCSQYRSGNFQIIRSAGIPAQ
jgi:hypothetical protein